METGYSVGPLTGILCLALFTLSVPRSCGEKTPFSFLSLFHPSSRLPYPHLAPHILSPAYHLSSRPVIFSSFSRSRCIISPQTSSLSRSGARIPSCASLCAAFPTHESSHFLPCHADLQRGASSEEGKGGRKKKRVALQMRRRGIQ